MTLARLMVSTISLLHLAQPICGYSQAYPMLETAKLASKKRVKKSKKTKKRSNVRKVSSSRWGHTKTDLAIGANTGWEAIYGTSISGHLYLFPGLEVNSGFGYNTSGFKLGVGSHYEFFPFRSFGFRFGSGLVLSLGNSGDVSVTADFKKTGSNTSEELIVTKSYSVSSGVLLNVSTGTVWAMTSSFHIVADLSYNILLSGAEVTLGDELKYDEEVEVTNEREFEPEFNEKAEEKAQPGGLGFLIGIRMKFMSF